MSGPYMVYATTAFHWVTKITAHTHGDGVLTLTLHGDPTVSENQFNDAEIKIFTDNLNLTDRLVSAINAVVDQPVEELA